MIEDRYIAGVMDTVDQRFRRVGCRFALQAEVRRCNRLEDCRYPLGSLGMAGRLMPDVLGISKDRDQAGAVAGCVRSVLIASRRRTAASRAAPA